MTPPGLAWLTSFSLSTGAALDQPILVEVTKTVNVLVYKVTLKWEEPIDPLHGLMVWNLLQKWAARNDSVLKGPIKFLKRRDRDLDRGISVEVQIKERLGHPKNSHPGA